MNPRDVLDYHTGIFNQGEQYVSNNDYMATSSAAVDAGSGRASLGILSVLILGVMFYYVATRSRQY